MSFENDKRTALTKIEECDKSKKGSIDKSIVKLVDLINSKRDFYTTSSCSGRVVLLAQSKSGKKHKAKQLFVSHSKITFNQIKESFKKLPKQQVWLRFEPLIMHVVASTIEDAQKLINLARGVGFKRTGIQSTRKKITAEICSTEKIDTPVAENGKLIVGDDYIKVLIREANKKFEKNKEKINKLKKKIKK